MRSGYFGQHFRKRQSVIAVIIIAMILTMIGMQAPAQENAKNYRSIVRKLAHIPAAKAKEHLLALGLGRDINTLDNINALIVTTDNIGDRLKVESLLTLIDSNLEYEVTRLSTAVDPRKIPDTATINAAIKGIEIGSFIDPPSGKDAAAAIIDIHNQDLISIAPKGLIAPITSGYAALQSNPKAQTKPLTIKNQAGIYQMSEMARASVTTAKPEAIVSSEPEATVKSNLESKALPDSAMTSVFDSRNSFSSTMQELRETQNAFSTAFKNADAGTVNEFMADASTAKQAALFAKSDSGDSSLLDIIKEAREKARIKRAEAADKAKAPKAAEPVEEPKPEVKKPVTPPKKPVEEQKKPSTRATDPRTRQAAPVAPKTSEKAAAPKKNDSMAGVMKMIEAMNASKAKASSPRTETVTSEPVKAKPAPVKAAPVKTPPVKPAATKTRPVRTTPGAVPAKTTTVKTEPKPPAAKVADDKSDEMLEMTIDLPTKVAVTKLLELVGMQLGLNYMYEPSVVTGDVTLFIHDGGKIKVSELYEMVQNVLKFKGLVMTRNGNLVTVTKQGEITSIDPKIILPGEDMGDIGDVVVAKVFKLKHVETATAQKMLTDMKLGITIQSIPENGTLIITGYAHRMGRMQEVLNLIDFQGAKKLFKHRMLEFLTPAELAPKLQVLAKELGTVSISVSSTTAAAAPRAATPTRTTASSSAAARAKALADARARAATAARNTKTTTSTVGKATSKTVYLDIDDRTNRILMIGLADSIAVVEDLIDILDVKQQGIKIIRQYPIEFVDATMVVDILSELGITSGGARPIAASTKAPTSSRAPTTSRGAVSGEGPRISILSESNSLLVNATHEKHDEIMAIIAHVDVLNPDLRTIEEYPIEHVDPTAILDTLAELGIVSGQSSRSSSSSQNSRYGSSTARPTSTSSKTSTARPTTAAPSSFSEPMADEPQIAILETTSALLVNATAKQHASIAMVIAHVDREQTRDSTPYVVYPLGNQDPVKLKVALDELVNATIAANTESKSTGSTKSSTTSKIISTSRSSGQVDPDDRATIVADEETRSLVVYASKKNQLWIGNLIAELDAYRSQVLLDVTLVEISKDNEFNLDLDMVTKYGGLNPAGAFSGAATELAGMIDPANWGGLIAEGRIANGSGIAFYADSHVQGLFKLMDKKNYGRVLARPSLLVKDNQEGQINATKTVYVGQEKTNVISGGTDNLSTSSDVTFTDYSSGITLTITPHIASDKLLQLDITLDRTDFDPSDPGTASLGGKVVPKPLNTVSSTVGTTAILPNGATIILGGIETLTQTKGVTKIPILGDIPIIGGLFRGIDESDTQSKLYVFVKANIIRPGDELSGFSDIERISRKKREAFESDEVNFQKLRAIPGFKPNPMQPENILEDDEYLKSLKATEPKKYIEIKL